TFDVRRQLSHQRLSTCNRPGSRTHFRSRRAINATAKSCDCPVGGGAMLASPKGNNILGASTTCSIAATVPITFALFSLPSPSGRGLGEGLTREAFSYL